MAFEKATNTRFEIITENDGTVKVFVAFELYDSVVSDEPFYVEHWITSDDIPGLKNIIDRGTLTSRKSALLGVIRPKLQEAYLKWKGIKDKQPTRIVKSRAEVETEFGIKEITSV